MFENYKNLLLVLTSLACSSLCANENLLESFHVGEGSPGVNLSYGLEFTEPVRLTLTMHCEQSNSPESTSKEIFRSSGFSENYRIGFIVSDGDHVKGASKTAIFGITTTDGGLQKNTLWKNESLCMTRPLWPAERTSIEEIIPREDEEMQGSELKLYERRTKNADSIFVLHLTLEKRKTQSATKRQNK